MDEFTSLIVSFISNYRTKKAIKNIQKNNELRRNITRYEPSDIEGFIERDQFVGSYIVSGGQNYYRARTAASIVACSLAQGLPVIVIHEGNVELQNQIANATSFTGNKAILTKNTSAYDPFYNRNDQEICNLILSSTGNGTNIAAVGQQYIIGVTEFIKSKNMPPYCDMFLRCPYDDLLDKIDDACNNGYMTDQKATQIRNQLMQGQTERANIQTFFGQLAAQGNGLLPSINNRAGVVNIRTAVEHNGMIMIDIGSSTNDIILNLLVNEVKEVLASGKKIMLVLDGISISSNVNLEKVLKSLSARCLTTLLSDDVYSMLGADDNLFNSFVGNACKCVVFSHTMGVSCSKWAEVFGYYDVDKISQSTQGTDNYSKFGYGFGSSTSISIATNREYVVKPEEIARMNSNEVLILDKNAKELAFSIIR